MAYTLTPEQWYEKMGVNVWGKTDDVGLGPLRKRPIPMRLISDRTIHETEHFTVMHSVVNEWGERRIALIERACSSIAITRIDPRLKSIKRIIRTCRVARHQTRIGNRMFKRFISELIVLADKCERLYPCHFMLKGVDYAKELPRDTAQT